MQGPRIPVELENNYSIVHQGILYVIRRENGDIHSIPENLTGNWETVRKLNKLPVRQGFPAQIVKYNDFC